MKHRPEESPSKRADAEEDEKAGFSAIYGETLVREFSKVGEGMAKERPGGDRHRPGYTKEYNKATYTQVIFRVRKDSNIVEGLELAQRLTGIPRSEYIRDAVEDKLRKDGYID